MDVEAIIHFVGLVVFTMQIDTEAAKAPKAIHYTQRPNSQVIAIMPEVKTGRSPVGVTEASTLRVSGKKRGSSPATAAEMSLEEVESHSTLIVFETWSREAWADDEPTFGWQVQQLNTESSNELSNFEYIELNHDRVSFIVDRPNGKAKIPPQLRHTGGVLKAAYAPPTKYASAAAVFDIPVGELTACISKTGGTNGRLDTELRLNTSGKITIKSGPKSLTLDANSPIYVVNVPKRYATHHDLKHTARNHFLVYCRMVGVTDANCHPPTAVDQQMDCKECFANVLIPPIPDDPSTPATTRMRLRGTQTPPMRVPPIPPIVALASFECSNSQYP